MRARYLVDTLSQPKCHRHILRLYKKHLSDPEIARRIGVSVMTVWRWRLKHNLPSNSAKGCHKPIDRVEEEKRMRAWRKGGSDRESARLCGLSLWGFRTWRVNRGLKANNPPKLRLKQFAIH